MIAEEVVSFYQQHFSQEEESTDYTLLDHTPNMISKNTSDFLCRIPDLEEIRKVVFMMTGGIVYGLDRLPSMFYYTWWQVIGGDVIKIVQVFSGHSLSKLTTHTGFTIKEREYIDFCIPQAPQSE